MSRQHSRLRRELLESGFPRVERLEATSGYHCPKELGIPANNLRQASTSKATLTSSSRIKPNVQFLIWKSFIGVLSIRNCTGALQMQSLGETAEVRICLISIVWTRFSSDFPGLESLTEAGYLTASAFTSRKKQLCGMHLPWPLFLVVLPTSFSQTGILKQLEASSIREKYLDTAVLFEHSADGNSRNRLQSDFADVPRVVPRVFLRCLASEPYNQNEVGCQSSRLREKKSTYDARWNLVSQRCDPMMQVSTQMGKFLAMSNSILRLAGPKDPACRVESVWWGPNRAAHRIGPSNLGAWEE